MKDYADNVKLYDYPNTLQTEGKETMRKSYKDWFDRVPDLRVHIKKRIVIGNKVIDEEQVTTNGQIFNAVAIYEIVKCPELEALNDPQCAEAFSTPETAPKAPIWADR